MSWNGSDVNSREDTTASAPSAKARYWGWLKGIVAMFVVVGGGACIWFFATSEPQATHQPETAEPVEVKVERKIAEVKLAAARQVMLPEVKEDLITLPDGTVTNRPKDLVEAYKMIPLKPGRHNYKSVDEFLASTNDFQIGPYHKRFTTDTEHMLGLIASVRPDQPLPPMPPSRGLDADFDRTMAVDVAFEIGESMQEMRLKKRVKDMKVDLARLVKEEGLTPTEALFEFEKEHNRRANLYQMYRSEYAKLVRAGDPVADAFYDKAQSVLQSEGAPQFDRDGTMISE